MTIQPLSEMEFMHMEIISKNLSTLVFNKDIEGIKQQIASLNRILSLVSGRPSIEHPLSEPKQTLIPDFNLQINQGFKPELVDRIIIGNGNSGSAHALYKDGTKFELNKSDQVYMFYLESIGIDLLKVIFHKDNERFSFYLNGNKELTRKKIGPNG